MAKEPRLRPDDQNPNTEEGTSPLPSMERLTSAPDPRGNARSDDDPRASDRSLDNPRINQFIADDRVRSEGYQTLDIDDLASMLNEFDTPPLPVPPKKDGFHRIWLSTTHPTDTIQRRARLGYQPVKSEDLGPDWKHVTHNTGEYVGCVAIKEMLLYEIPEARYQQIMTYFHSYRPAEDEGKVASMIEQAKQGLHGTGGYRLVREIGDGSAAMSGREIRPRSFHSQG